MSKQFVLVVYDISSDKRRTRLHNKLLDFGTPVQYSVFECLLGAEELAREVVRLADSGAADCRFPPAHSLLDGWPTDRRADL